MNPFRPQRMQALADGAPRVRAEGAFRAELTADGGEMWLYDVIDPWGGPWGISASEIVQALQGAGPVTVHINSPGGDVFEAIAIHANFAKHTSPVTMIVEGVAASAASMILTAAARVEVAQHAQVMIHDAWSFEAGDEASMLKTADLLGRTSQNMAGAYAAKAGGDPVEWRALMKATTWYIGAEEIIAAGLADAVVSVGAAPVEQQVEEAFAQWDLSIYGKVPEPRGPVAVLTDPVEPEIIPVEVPVFGNRFAALAQQSAAEAAPAFGNKFREVSKEMKTR